MKQILASLQVIQHSLTEWWYSWLPLAILNTILVLCWITIIFGPPATFGFYHAIHYSTEWRDMFEGAKMYFFKSWLWMLMNVAFVLLLRISIEFYSQFAETTVLLIVVLVIALLWFCTQFYAIPFFMQQEQKQLLTALRNGLFTFLASPLYTLILVIVALVMVWLSMSFPVVFLIGTPAFIAMLGTQAVRERLKTFKIIQEE